MLKDEVAKALKVIQDGGIILYPTDTIWGIGCDATNTEAIKKIFRLKQRDEAKSMLVLLDTDAKLPSYISDVPDLAYDLIEFAENPLTLIMPGAKNISPALITDIIDPSLERLLGETKDQCNNLDENMEQVLEEVNFEFLP